MKSEIESESNCEIVSSRIVSYPADLIFRAWTEAEHIKTWWGPKGFTNTFTEFDPRPGGKWKFIMHGPDKGNYVNECEFIKVERPSYISWKRFSKPLFRVEVNFSEVSENRTQIVFRQIFDSEEECSKIKKYTVGKNDENFDKLEKELAGMV